MRWPTKHSSALSFLADEAIRFYITAYLVADLAGALHRAEPTFTLTLGFNDTSRDKRIWPRRKKTWTDFARARWDALSQKQAGAIVLYLEWCVERGGRIMERSTVEALAAYWHPRAAGLPLHLPATT